MIKQINVQKLTQKQNKKKLARGTEKSRGENDLRPY